MQFFFLYFKVQATVCKTLSSPLMIAIVSTLSLGLAAEFPLQGLASFLGQDHTTDAWQIAAYSSAGPDRLSESATISDGKNVLREGTNGWTCMPANPRGMEHPEKGWTDAHEAMPVCFDGAGYQWISAWMSGEPPAMERDAYIWMLQGDRGEDNAVAHEVNVPYDADDPTDFIESGPHLMMMPKDAASLAAFPTDFHTGEPYVMWQGSKYAHLMIPTVGYYKYSKPRAERDSLAFYHLSEPSGLDAEPAAKVSGLWGVFPVGLLGCGERFSFIR